MTNHISAFHVAAFLLHLDQETSKQSLEYRTKWEPITNLKLQKLLYYCQANTLLSSELPLFKNKIIAWKYGPVVKEVYEKYSEFKADFLYQKIRIPNNILSLDKVYRDSIEYIYNQFRDEGSNILIIRTRNEMPWINAYQTLGVGSEIKSSAIYRYYFNKTGFKPVPVEKSNIFIVLINLFKKHILKKSGFNELIHS